MSQEGRPPVGGDDDAYTDDDIVYDEAPATPSPRRRERTPRTDGPTIDLTNMAVRIMLVFLLIGLAVVLIFLLWNPLGGRTPTPTPTVLAAEGSPIVLPTFTPGPTATPLASATPVLAEATATSAPAPSNGTLAVGGTATIANTDGSGANMRASASRSAEIVRLLQDGTSLKVLEGPTTADDLQWWKVELSDEAVSGWVAEPFLSVAAP